MRPVCDRGYLLRVWYGQELLGTIREWLDLVSRSGATSASFEAVKRTTAGIDGSKRATMTLTPEENGARVHNGDGASEQDGGPDRLNAAEQSTHQVSLPCRLSAHLVISGTDLAYSSQSVTAAQQQLRQGSVLIGKHLEARSQHDPSSRK
eukprot:2691502-Rhodomonas_salina.3